MLNPNQHNDVQKVQLLTLLAEIKKIRKDIGGYIEHFYHNEQTIIVKLSNGIFKIKEPVLEKHFSEEGKLSDKELKKLAESFVVSTMG